MKRLQNYMLDIIRTMYVTGDSVKGCSKMYNCNKQGFLVVANIY